MKRIIGGDVTATLVGAVEQASDMGATSAIVILFRRDAAKEDYKFLNSKELTVETANWLIDRAKFTILNGD